MGETISPVVEEVANAEGGDVQTKMAAMTLLGTLTESPVCGNLMPKPVKGGRGTWRGFSSTIPPGAGGEVEIPGVIFLDVPDVGGGTILPGDIEGLDVLPLDIGRTIPGGAGTVIIPEFGLREEPKESEKPVDE